jgi:cytochrome c peroxidase
VIANGRLIGVQGRTSRPAVIAAIALLGAVATGAAGKDEQAGGVAVSITVTDEIARVVAEIDEIEAATLERLRQPPDNQVQQIELLGKLLLFDKELSVNRNEACAFCHMPEAGFTGPISELNRTFAAYPGSVRTRFSNRKPQTHSYAAYSPVLHYNAYRGDLVGGNFWDMRATGRRLGNPAAEQAQGPPTNPVEMGLPDTACMIYRVSQRPYKGFFESVWGKQALDIAWPSGIEDVCNTPGSAPPGAPPPVRLSIKDRDVASADFDRIAMSIAQYEASHEVSPFSSKFDAVLGGKAAFSAQEQEGYDLFRGKANCNTCHRDGGPGEEPLFTDFTASNIGTPANPVLPFYKEDKPDSIGYVANADGASYVDLGVGAFLENKHLLSRPSIPDTNWVKHAMDNNGRVQVPTLRNVDKRPYPEFVKAYGHNGYFKSLKEIVHFYNTRDVLPRCKPGDPREKLTCWPPPETKANMNTKTVGRLGLTEAEEDALVAFMGTLTDGYQAASK